MAFINVEVDKNLWDILDEVHKDTGINKAKQLKYLIAFRNDDKAVTKAFLYNVCASEMLEEAKSVNAKAKKLINKVKNGDV
jgi:hypothetical protein